ncbi:hypothetical protein M427DRAFT_133438 [Gonapodya prolifera JEL478]|uniref:Uncharacterized protein n=1 Tax=Gonapodya prolifera (strain JEL478) TaxID=1344416 RepID=A0A139ALT5_GONPJ|nr:hypothetical protein M427DRAFT_133438 [Gonapodya prolifera JEL478]|eukprot:KXS17648.1 hypothetical protein M427DRAFT_133438 [Gonapodya prolifera JEL478]
MEIFERLRQRLNSPGQSQRNLPSADPAAALAKSLSRFQRAWSLLLSALDTNKGGRGGDQRSSSGAAPRRRVSGYDGVAVERTDIPACVDEILRILTWEARTTQDNEAFGPCLEFAIDHNLFQRLVTLASTDVPVGSLRECARLFSDLVSAVPPRLITQKAIHTPLSQVLDIFADLAERTTRGSGVLGPTAAAPNGPQTILYEEQTAELAFNLARSIREYPQLLNVFFDRGAVSTPSTSPPNTPPRSPQSHRRNLSVVSVTATDAKTGVSLTAESRSSGQKKTSVVHSSSSSPSPWSVVAAGDMLSLKSHRDGTPGRPNDDDTSQAGVSVEPRSTTTFPLLSLILNFLHKSSRSGDFGRQALVYVSHQATSGSPLEQHLKDARLAELLTAAMGASWAEGFGEREVKREAWRREVKASRAVMEARQAREAASAKGNVDRAKAMPGSHEPPSTASSTSSLVLPPPELPDPLASFLSLLENFSTLLEVCPSSLLCTDLLASFRSLFLEQVLLPELREQAPPEVVTGTSRLVERAPDGPVRAMVVGVLTSPESRNALLRGLLGEDPASRPGRAELERREPAAVAGMRLITSLVSAGGGDALFSGWNWIKGEADGREEVERYLALAAKLNCMDGETDNALEKNPLSDLQLSDSSRRLGAYLEDIEATMGVKTEETFIGWDVDPIPKKGPERCSPEGCMDNPPKKDERSAVTSEDTLLHPLGDDSSPALADDLLVYVLTRLDDFFNNTSEFNLALTGLVTTLATTMTQGGLFVRLFFADSVNPAAQSVFSCLQSSLRIVEDRRREFEKRGAAGRFPEFVGKARVGMERDALATVNRVSGVAAGDELSDKARLREFWRNVVILQEFTKECVAVVECCAVVER